MKVEFVIPGSDRPPAFDALEEGLDVMAEPVITAVKRSRRFPIGARRNRRRSAFSLQCLSKGIRVISLVCDDTLSYRRPDLLRCLHIGAVAGSQCELQRPALGIDQSGELGVEPTFGAADGMSALSARRIRSILMDLDVSCVERAEVSLRVRGQCIEDSRPDSRVIPSAPSGIDRSPRAEVAGEIALGTADSNSVDHGLHHQTVVFWRASSTRALSRYRYRNFRRVVNFLSRSKSGSVNVRRGGASILRAPCKTILTNVLFNKNGFEDTP